MGVLCVGAGFLAGLVDAIAGGGGLLTVPALLAAGLPPHVALGTNKGQSVFGAVVSAATYWRRGAVDRRRALGGFVCGAMGSVVGATVALRLGPDALRPIIMVLLVLGAATLLVRRDRLPGPWVRAGTPIALGWILAVAFPLGAYDGFFGPGTGSFVIMAMVIVFGDSLTAASANAKIVNLASNFAAVAMFAWRGTVVWPLALSMAAANMVGAYVGARLALKRGDRLVRAVVLCVVGAVLVKLGADVARAGP
jgi:uncharacterized membrane protein YfcA